MFPSVTNMISYASPQHFALLSVIFMMGFVMTFDRMHWRHRFSWRHWSRNLMSAEESEAILRILAAAEAEPGA